jgi:hypothetical protein
MGVADHVLESITGRLSRRMLEQYSHIPSAGKARFATLLAAELRPDGVLGFLALLRREHGKDDVAHQRAQGLPGWAVLAP